MECVVVAGGCPGERGVRCAALGVTVACSQSGGRAESEGPSSSSSSGHKLGLSTKTFFHPRQLLSKAPLSLLPAIRPSVTQLPEWPAQRSLSKWRAASVFCFTYINNKLCPMHICFFYFVLPMQLKMIDIGKRGGGTRCFSLCPVCG